MSLLTIAEVLSGEAVLSPGGPVDRLTAAADDVALWDEAAEAAAVSAAAPVPHEDALVPV